MIIVLRRMQIRTSIGMMVTSIRGLVYRVSTNKIRNSASGYMGSIHDHLKYRGVVGDDNQGVESKYEKKDERKEEGTVQKP